MSYQNNKEKKILAVGLILVALVVIVTFARSIWSNKETAGILSQKEKVNYPTISTQDLQKKIAANEPLQIIDVRSTDDYQQEHIIDSQNIPLEELEASASNVSADKMVIVLGYGDSADSDQQAVQILEKNNIKNVAVLLGGISGWKQEGGGTISWGDPTSFTEQAKVTFITQEDFSSLMKDNPAGLYILDTRPVNSFSEGHLPQAQNIPLNELEKSRSNIPLSKIIVVYGETELDGFQAGVGLYDLGFYTTKVLRGGFSDWKDKGLEIVK